MSDLDAILSRAAIRVLEELCFVFAVPLLSDGQRAAAAEGAMGVRFRGDRRSGCLVVRIAGGMLPVLAANMLGDAAASTRMQHDALGELANVVCGTVLPLISAPSDTYRLAHAEPALLLERELPRAAAVVRIGLEDVGRADVILFLDAA